MPTFSAKISGIEELQRKLRTLPTKAQGKVIRPALRAGAKIAERAVESITPKRTGALKRSLKVRSGNIRKKGVTRMVVMTSGEGGNLFKGKQYYGGFVHYGHGIGKRSRAVASFQERASRAGKRGDFKERKSLKAAEAKIDKRQRVKANPFVKRGFDKSKSQAEHVVLAMIASGIEREAAR
jgi:HK97 gp10 family phage protein